MNAINTPTIAATGVTSLAIIDDDGVITGRTYLHIGEDGKVRDMDGQEARLLPTGRFDQFFEREVYSLELRWGWHIMNWKWEALFDVIVDPHTA